MRVCRSTIVVVAALLCRASQAATWYVAAEAGDDANDGRGWLTAFASLQKAIDVIASNDVVLVEKGVYGPIKSTNSGLGFTITAIRGAAETLTW